MLITDSEHFICLYNVFVTIVKLFVDVVFWLIVCSPRCHGCATGCHPLPNVHVLLLLCTVSSHKCHGYIWRSGYSLVQFIQRQLLKRQFCKKY